MSELVKYEVIDFPGGRVMGKEVTCKMGAEVMPIPALWDRCFADGTFQRLEALGDAVQERNYVDWTGEFNPATGEFLCIVGMIMKAGTPAPQGYAYRDLAPTRMAIGYVRGIEKSGEIYKDAGDLACRAVVENGDAIDEEKGYILEVYDCERFVAPQERGEEYVVLDNYVPIK